MKTKQLNVRLSDTAWDNLAAICQASGINQTAAVEIALAELKARLIQDDLSIASQEFISTDRPPVGDPLEG